MKTEVRLAGCGQCCSGGSSPSQRSGLEEASLEGKGGRGRWVVWVVGGSYY